MGRTASLVAAAQEGTDAEVVVTLSAPISIEGLVAGPDALAAGRREQAVHRRVGDAAAADAEELYATSPPPKRVAIVPADDHGTDERVRRARWSAARSRRTSRSSRRRDPASGRGSIDGSGVPGTGPGKGARSLLAITIW